MKEKCDNCNGTEQDLFKHVAEKLADDLFEVGSEPDSPCRRIEFKGGDYFAQSEKAQGGYCKKALVTQFQKSMKEYFGA